MRLQPPHVCLYIAIKLVQKKIYAKVAKGFYLVHLLLGPYLFHVFVYVVNIVCMCIG